MIDNYETGQVLNGKVRGIQSYGAFVALDDETQGLVHISEITHSYVQDIHAFLTVGDDVNVKVLSVDTEKNRISLSIRATEEPSQEHANPSKSAAPKQADNTNSGFNILESKLDEWIQQSEDRKKTFKN
ncbi:S1 domain-containing post-transcriptional regulator GSP13 [Barrientosiimonas marina]|uniref:S1 domain-containing post-transcriptional regulator GSP13 n=1 Tax=Lentibacillus kimchii TaxID=1542911 RepID=A0ABW2UU33_9BACI